MKKISFFVSICLSFLLFYLGQTQAINPVNDSLPSMTIEAKNKLENNSLQAIKTLLNLGLPPTLSNIQAVVSLKEIGISITPYTIAAVEIDPLHVLPVLKKTVNKADHLAQAIIKGFVDPKDLHEIEMAAKILDIYASIPPNLSKTIKTFQRKKAEMVPLDLIIGAHFLSPMRSLETPKEKVLKALYLHASQYLDEQHALTVRGERREPERINLRLKSLMDYPSYYDADHLPFFEQQLLELNSNPILTLKRLEDVRRDITILETQLNAFHPDQDSDVFQDLQRRLEKNNHYLSLFPQEILKEYKRLSEKREALIQQDGISHPDVKKIEREIETLSRQEVLRIHYRDAYLNHHPKSSFVKSFMKNKFLQTTSPREFSGALAWAHKNNITGKGSSVLVIEVLKKLPIQEQLPLTHHLDHALRVTNIVHQIAPAADIMFAPYSMNPQETLDHYGLYPQLEKPRKIINISFSDKNVSRFSRTVRLLDSSGEHMFIFAAGNKSSPKEATLLETDLYSTLEDHSIYVGNLKSDFNRAELSNYPGDNPHPLGNDYFQKRFLWVLGTNVGAQTIKDNYGDSGTSFAAPVVSGAVALIQNKNPNLSMSEIQMILLQSALQNFYRRVEDQEGKTRYVYVYNPLDPVNKGMRPQKDAEVFDPVYWGKGILSIQRAHIYAEIYSTLKEKFPSLSPEKLKVTADQIFENVIYKREKKSAKVIQEAIRSFLTKQKGSLTKVSSRKESVAPSLESRLPSPVFPEPSSHLKSEKGSAASQILKKQGPPTLPKPRLKK